MKKRILNLKRMHQIIRFLNNEEAYNTWILYVPDEPTENDFKDIAEDIDDYDDVVDLFIRLVYKYAYESGSGLMQTNPDQFVQNKWSDSYGS